MKTVSGQPGDYRDKNKSEENPGLDRRVGDGSIFKSSEKPGWIEWTNPH